MGLVHSWLCNLYVFSADFFSLTKTLEDISLLLIVVASLVSVLYSDLVVCSLRNLGRRK